MHLKEFSSQSLLEISLRSIEEDPQTELHSENNFLLAFKKYSRKILRLGIPSMISYSAYMFMEIITFFSLDD